MILPPNPDDYEILHQIGHNSFSDLYSARCKTNDQLISVRIISMEHSPVDLANLRKGGSLWMTSSHDNLSRYYGSFEVGSTLWVISEYIDGGSIRDILRYGYNHGIKNEVLISAILKPVLEFLSIFHQNMHIHRSINTDVILVKTDGTIKISNLSFASSLIEGGKRKGALFSLSYGCDTYSSCYAAPEVLSGSGYTQSSDIWSVGIVAIELSTGIIPFSNLTELDRIKTIITGPPPTIQSVREGQYIDQDSAVKKRKSSFSNKEVKSNGSSNFASEFSPVFLDFIDQCLKKQPEKRPSVNRLLEHKLFKNMATSLNCNIAANISSNCKSYIARVLMAQLPPLNQRFESLVNMKPFGDRKTSHVQFTNTAESAASKKKIGKQQSSPTLAALNNLSFLFDDSEFNNGAGKQNTISCSASFFNPPKRDWIFEDDIQMNNPEKVKVNKNKKTDDDMIELNNEDENGEIEIDDEQPTHVGRFSIRKSHAPRSLPKRNSLGFLDDT